MTPLSPSSLYVLLLPYTTCGRHPPRALLPGRARAYCFNLVPLPPTTLWKSAKRESSSSWMPKASVVTLQGEDAWRR